MGAANDVTRGLTAACGTRVVRIDVVEVVNMIFGNDGVAPISAITEVLEFKALSIVGDLSFRFGFGVDAAPRETMAGLSSTKHGASFSNKFKPLGRSFGSLRHIIYDGPPCKSSDCCDSFAWVQ